MRAPSGCPVLHRMMAVGTAPGAKPAEGGAAVPAITWEPFQVKRRIVDGPVGQQSASPSRKVGYPSVTVLPSWRTMSRYHASPVRSETPAKWLP